MTSTTTTTLRLPPDLAALARARAESIGVSLNALICVALDAYLAAPAAAPVPPPAVALKAAPAAPAVAPRTAPAVAPTMNREQRRAAKSKKRR